MDIEKILQNPEIVQIHREPARAYYIPFQDGAMALQADKEEVCLLCAAGRRLGLCVLWAIL